MSWLGKTVQGFEIKEHLAAGAFAALYLGVREVDGSRLVFKVAHSGPAVDASDLCRTKALMFITGGVRSVQPDAASLLSAQYQLLKRKTRWWLARTYDLVLDPPDSYYTMEFIEGKTLRQLMREGPIDTDLLVEIARCAERARRSFGAHGDLKPENIMISSGEIKLIDPGHFGPMRTNDGDVDPCIVTTPAYYPLLQPNDVFALGVMLWEIVFKQHPFLLEGYPGPIDENRIGDDLYDWVHLRELVGQYFLSPILRIPRPREMDPDMPPVFEEFLLKALSLRVAEDGRLGTDPGFERPQFLALELRRVCALCRITEL